MTKFYYGNTCYLLIMTWKLGPVEKFKTISMQLHVAYPENPVSMILLSWDFIAVMQLILQPQTEHHFGELESSLSPASEALYGVPWQLHFV